VIFLYGLAQVDEKQQTILDMKTKVIELQQELEIVRRRARIDADCATDPRCEFLCMFCMCTECSIVNVMFFFHNAQKFHLSQTEIYTLPAQHADNTHTHVYSHVI
jgi:hypothetical protein